jgi:hypothetical protein
LLCAENRGVPARKKNMTLAIISGEKLSYGSVRTLLQTREVLNKLSLKIA